MLIGMGLMKLGVFSGRRSRRFYIWYGRPRIRHRPASDGFDAYELIRTNFGLSFQIHGGIFPTFSAA